MYIEKNIYLFLPDVPEEVEVPLRREFVLLLLSLEFTVDSLLLVELLLLLEDVPVLSVVPLLVDVFGAVVDCLVDPDCVLEELVPDSLLL
ncbi:hypothetical protein AGMMS49574_06950 [Bacteroidia bacterium]|nr:hypothetical protein AGMMS49574_06950 [Bacteroidia bacterium]